MFVPSLPAPPPIPPGNKNENENTQKHHKKQGTVAGGVSLQLLYLHHYGMWAVFYPLFAELVFILYLAGLKLYFEHHLFGLGRGGAYRPFVAKEETLAEPSSRDDYSVVGGAGGGGGGDRREGTTLDSSPVGAADGGDGGADVAGGEGSGDDAAAVDAAGRELEGARKRHPANTGDEVNYCCCCCSSGVSSSC